jgi:segregation and condensation protein B
MAAGPVTIHELTRIMKAETFAESMVVLEELMREFNTRQSPLEVTKTGKSRYVMRVRDKYHDSVSHLAVSTEFSKAVLRTLGLIAVKQPVKQSIVVAIIGNKAYDYIKELQQKGFVRGTKHRNTKILGVTPKFESYFGKKAEELANL